MYSSPPKCCLKDQKFFPLSSYKILRIVLRRCTFEQLSLWRNGNTWWRKLWKTGSSDNGKPRWAFFAGIKKINTSVREILFGEIRIIGRDNSQGSFPSLCNQHIEIWQLWSRFSSTQSRRTCYYYPLHKQYASRAHTHSCNPTSNTHVPAPRPPLPSFSFSFTLASASLHSLIKSVSGGSPAHFSSSLSLLHSSNNNFYLETRKFIWCFLFSGHISPSFRQAKENSWPLHSA